MRNLVLVLGDQLDRNSAAFDDLDAAADAVWMAEVEEEATYVRCHKQRIALFFSAMRHFRDELWDRGYDVHYHELSAKRGAERGENLAAVLRSDIDRLRPEKLIVVLPGDWRVKQSIEQASRESKVPLELRVDRHFYCQVDEFAEFAEGRKTLLLETFYRRMRKQHDILMDGREPIGGKWNFDHDNRQSFSAQGPANVTGPRTFRTDPVTEDVFDLVETRFPDHPGSLDDFNLPVNHEQAMAMLHDFVERSLPEFGAYEDAMWNDEPFLYHSRLSAPLNLKLLDPRKCVDVAIDAYQAGHAPLNSVEGFIRQIVGWREFVRGIYWLHMPEYIENNYLDHQLDLPSFFWDGETDMQCVRQSMSHVLRFGYAHHIHRLMVLGNLALLLGVHPRKFHDWHMAMYLDAVDWVSLPNTLGMSQHGDGGVVGTKPYVSTGNYIHRMSNFCESCRYNYKQSSGSDACPISTLYWEFLDRHQQRFSKNTRMKMQLKNVDRKREKGELSAIREQADRLRTAWYKHSQ